MKGMKPGGRERPSRESESGRVCVESGCDTTLSVYNRKDRCWQHTEIAFPTYRGRRLGEGDAAAI